MKRQLLAVLLCSLAGPAAWAADCSPTTFIRARQFSAGASVQAVVAGDFNHDGQQDLAVATGTGVSVLLGDGSGGFLPPVNADIGAQPQALVVGFFDAGNDLDLAIIQGYTSIEILLGNGDGTFTPGDTYPINYGPANLLTADFDKNGKPDLMVTAQNSGALVVLLGNGDGTFGAPISTTTPQPSLGIAAADFDGDGFPDVAASQYGGAVVLYHGLGEGHFAAGTTLKIGGSLGPIVAADLNGDGHQDVIVAADNFVAIARGNGDGTFQAATESLIGYPASFLIAADLDGDGRADIAALRQNSVPTAGVVSILHQRTDGFFEDGGSYVVGPGAWTLTSADFNGDGLGDLATANLGATSVSVLYGLTATQMEATLRVPLTNGPIALAVADFAGDQRQDVAVLLAGSPSSIAVVGRDSDGRLRQIGSTIVSGTPAYVAAGHFVPGSHGDLVVTDYYNGFSILLGRGDGTFAPPVPYASGIALNYVTVADFNGDGNDDVIAVEWQNPYPNGTLAVFLGAGDGTFSPGPTAPLLFQTTGLLAVDVDEDGRMDVVTPNGYADNSISVYRGFLVGFDTPVQLPAGPDPVAVAAGIFTNIHTDLIVADAGGSVAALLRAGGGPPLFIGVAAPPVLVATGDFDGDGHLDFVTASNNGTSVSLLRGNGDYTFQAPELYSLESSPMAIGVGALSGSALDLVVANAYNALSLSVMENAKVSGQIVAPSPTLVGNPMSIGVLASGFGPLSYQWYQNGLPLPEGAKFFGTTTSVLGINGVTFPDTAATYDVAITDSCGLAVVFAPPLVVEFADVPPSNIFHDDIVTIAKNGVTAGCGGADYCPTGLVTRAQMSVFLLKSEHGSSYVPPACTGVFADVACPSPFADWIEQLATEQVTAGCGGNDYCPDASITRAQMAVFLLKTKLGSGYVPPPAVGIFGDVPPGSFAADWIEDLYNRGIAGGCSASPLLYCPGNPVNRGQMAAFLVNTFF